MNCQIPQCGAPSRWHQTLCQEHVKQVPESMQYAVYRSWADLKRSCRKTAVISTALRYQAALRSAVKVVAAREPA